MAEMTVDQAMGVALREFAQGRAQAAAEICAQIVAAFPKHPPAVHLLGVIALQNGDHAQAHELLSRAIVLAPEMAEYRNNLGVLLRSMGKLDEAESQFRSAIRLRPDYADAMSNLGALLGNQGSLSESIELNRRAAEARPGSDTLNNYANALMRQGKVLEAMGVYREALNFLSDDPRARSNFLLVSNYDPSISKRDLFEEHVRWGKRLGELIKPARDHQCDRDPNRRLRIGYVSPDFRAHSVTYFITPILKHHDREQIEVFCYANVHKEDDMTARVKMLVGPSSWRSITGQPDAKAVEIIRRDQIDILIDLASHTAQNRVPLFAHKPAPIQVSYLGYPNTSGLAAMDYRLTDSIADPPGESDELNVETLIRIDPCAWCFEPHPQAPPVAPPPFERNGVITFGSFNALTKANAQVIETWANILHRVAGSKFAMKAGAFADPPTKERFVQTFAGHGIPRERLDLSGHIIDVAGHLRSYERLDLALDTFPYNGTTTTCEAMWMGVPVITLGGDRHAGRVGESLLRSVGLPDLTAKSIDEYIELAVKLASQPQRLGELRRTMRDRMRASPLMDGAAMAKRIESAYRDMWRRSCQADVRSAAERK